MFDKEKLIALRNLTLALHASAGHLITVPTDGAIAGSADEDEIRISMMAYLSLIQLNIVNICRVLGVPQAQIQQMIDNALAS
jgi:hypothetical protein